MPQNASPTSTAAPPPCPSTGIESSFLVILAVLLCAMICLLGLFAATRCCVFLRRTNTTTTPPSSSAKGLKKKAVQSLPKFTYTSSPHQQQTQEHGNATNCSGNCNIDCAICLGEFVAGEEIRILPQCGHLFHVACIDTWLGRHSSCPKCRRALVIGRSQKCRDATAAEAGTGDEGKRRTEGGSSGGDFFP